MTPILGTFERHADGVLTGVFRSLTLRAQVELRPSPPSDGVRSYAVIAAPEFQLGVGRQDAAAPLGLIMLTLKAPEFARDVEAQLIHVHGDIWSLVWSGVWT